MNIPLQLTASRILMAAVIGIVLLLPVPYRASICAILFIVAAVTDFIDGKLARAWGQSTPLGAFLDPLGDKLLVYLTFIYLTVVGMYPAWLLLLLFTRDIVTDSLRGFAAGKGVSMAANLPSKWKTLCQMSSIALLLVLVSITELASKGAVSSAFLSAPLFEQAFGLTFWLMVIAAAVGIVGTVQYVVAYAPRLFAPRPSAL